MLVRKYWN